MIYELTSSGRALRLSEWKKMGGSGLSHMAEHRVSLHYEQCIANWEAIDPTLGELSDIDPSIGRSLSRFAVLQLNRKEFGEPR